MKISSSSALITPATTSNSKITQNNANDSNNTSPVASHLKLLIKNMSTLKKDNTSILTEINETNESFDSSASNESKADRLKCFKDECKRLAIQKLFNDLNTRTAEKNSTEKSVKAIHSDETDKSTFNE